MASEGHALIFISHKLHEVQAISDRVTVLRDGRVVGERATHSVTRAELAQLMVGRDVRPMLAQPRTPGPAALRLTDVRAQGDRGRECLSGVSLEVCGGEIVGVAGVSGNGQRELAQCLAGLRRVTGGSVTLSGVDLTHATPRGRIAAGLAYVPEERMRDGSVRDFSVLENVFLHDHAAPKFTRGVFMNLPAMQAHARDLMTRYNVKTPSLETPLKNLSGGNIQKLILARELSRRPRVLIAAQPTRGVDIGATEYIHQRLLEQRADGTAILLISEDLDEIQTLSDRIIVMYEGRVMGIFGRGEATPQALGLLMAGVADGKA
jgi:general nucleoside transport system ATP-binding protein